MLLLRVVVCNKPPRWVMLPPVWGGAAVTDSIHFHNMVPALAVALVAAALVAAALVAELAAAVAAGYAARPLVVVVGRID